MIKPGPANYRRQIALSSRRHSRTVIIGGNKSPHATHDAPKHPRCLLEEYILLLIPRRETIERKSQDDLPRPESFRFIRHAESTITQVPTRSSPGAVGELSSGTF